MEVTEQAHILTNEDYEIAESNGIERHVLDLRFYAYYWDKERALTEPVRIYKKSKWRRKAKELGIVSVRTYDRRVNRGWDEERAATEPPTSKDRMREINRETQRKFSKELYEKLERNGISNDLFRDRMRRKWTFEEASTLPPGTQLLDYYRNRVRELEGSKNG